ncbi:CLUMA_CG017483, isoform A [Clunio marinus]|uniref:CLUMA_CG017483, isoform A n=1 Tax=Clunio marinus TaxID=568069 RepID=A0A1J1IW11_9DIPT|nr:CLUMA_CG017483, isoform A [Clunio marinus]
MSQKQSKNSVPSLYFASLQHFVNQMNYTVDCLNKIPQLRLLPPAILSDIYCEMAENKDLRDGLLVELSDVDLFCKLIKYQLIRDNMLKIFKLLMTNNKPLVSELQRIFVQRGQLLLSEQIDQMRNSKLIANEVDMDTEDSTTEFINDDYQLSRQYRKEIDKGLRLGTFLYESGWLDDSLKVLKVTKSMINQLGEDYQKLLLMLSCLQKLLHVQALFCCYKDASITTSQALNLIEKIHNIYSESGVPESLLANIYHELSVLHFNRSEYDLSYKWGVKGLEYLRINTPAKISVDVLRQAAKSCVVKRKFQIANLLINSAVRIAENAFGDHHTVYADALLDKGFFLLNVDSINKSVEVYMEALKIKCCIFGEKNLNVAVIHEDLAYALYVYEYSRGHFNMARFYVEKAIQIMSELAPSNEIMLASAKRVKALILEEIALDNMVTPNARDFKGLLKESEDLHQSALQLSLDAFGEINVQTAKHYGNLGRLYQSMTKYEDAEDMHQRAIKIKRDLLGDYDYEVGLSIGHLASLYNYHMKKYREAEDLYLKSIHISLKLFGQTYSGLEYDYRGLLHVYEELHDNENYMKFCDVLDEWRILRSDERKKPRFIELSEDATVEDVTKKFFEMSAES